jgi:hypothetical protein
MKATMAGDSGTVQILRQRKLDLAYYLPAIRTTLVAVALLALFITLFALVQFATPGLAGNDGYYHVKFGYLIREHGLTPAFETLPFTILKAGDFYDHHFLYHAFLSLFARTDPAVDGGQALTQGAKIASIVMPALAFLAIWWLLRAQKVPWPALWVLALFALSEAFLYRMSMPRAQSMSLLLLILGLHWLLTGRYKLLLPVGFIYVWSYNAFPLLMAVSGAYFAATFLLERRLVWQVLLYPTAGIVLGLMINPYFPQNLVFIANHWIPKLGESTTQVGNEWSPYRTETLLNNSGLALAAVALGILALGWQERRIDKRTLVAFGLVVVFGAMLFQSRRFIEYFPPFALIFLALSAAPLLQKWAKTRFGARPATRIILPAGLILLLIYPLYHSVSDGRKLMERSKPANQYADAALWLGQQTSPGTMVFQTDWDDFTRLFFYNSDLQYTAGLDPTFMERHDAELFDEWVAITRGKVENPSNNIRQRFGAEYVFSDLKHDNFLDQAAQDPGLEEIYRDEYAVIFVVNK